VAKRSSRRKSAYVSTELAHFVGRQKPRTAEARYRRLHEIVESGTLLPGVAGDAISVALPLFGEKPEFSRETLSKVRAVCFCDIPRKAISIHVRKFGPFGLAFDKGFLIRHGANPVFYIAIDDELPIHPKGNRGAHFDKMMNDISLLTVLPMDRDSGLSSAQKESLTRVTDFLWHHVLAFAKPFEALSGWNSKAHTYMKREWRLLGQLDFELKDIRRIFLPRAFRSRFRRDFPSYSGSISLVGR
jgi:hypothetical protein